MSLSGNLSNQNISVNVILGTNVNTGSVTTTNASNQIIIQPGGTGNSITLSATNPSAARTYTIPDVGANAALVLTDGNQTIGGVKTFSRGVYINSTDEPILEMIGSRVGADTVGAVINGGISGGSSKNSIKLYEGNTIAGNNTSADIVFETKFYSSAAGDVARQSRILMRTATALNTAADVMELRNNGVMQLHRYTTAGLLTNDTAGVITRTKAPQVDSIAIGAPSITIISSSATKQTYTLPNLGVDGTFSVQKREDVVVDWLSDLTQTVITSGYVVTAVRDKNIITISLKDPFGGSVASGFGNVITSSNALPSEYCPVNNQNFCVLTVNNGVFNFVWLTVLTTGYILIYSDPQPLSTNEWINDVSIYATTFSYLTA